LGIWGQMCCPIGESKSSVDIVVTY
jgi:hypothetical protein